MKGVGIVWVILRCVLYMYVHGEGVVVLYEERQVGGCFQAVALIVGCLVVTCHAGFVIVLAYAMFCIDYGDVGPCVPFSVLHGESITDQASPRTPTQRTFQPQEAVQPQRNQTILQADTPAQKANYSYKRSHPMMMSFLRVTPSCLQVCDVCSLQRWEDHFRCTSKGSMCSK